MKKIYTLFLILISLVANVNANDFPCTHYDVSALQYNGWDDGVSNCSNLLYMQFRYTYQTYNRYYLYLEFSLSDRGRQYNNITGPKPGKYYFAVPNGNDFSPTIDKALAYSSNYSDYSSMAWNDHYWSQSGWKRYASWQFDGTGSEYYILVEEGLNGDIYMEIHNYEAGWGDVDVTIGERNPNRVTIPLTITTWNDNTGADNLTDTEPKGNWQYLLFGGNGTGSDSKSYTVNFALNTNSPTGSFSYSSIDWTKSYIRQGNTNISVGSVSSFTISSSQERIYDFEATIIGSDGETYIITGVYSNCPREETPPADDVPCTVDFTSNQVSISQESTKGSGNNDLCGADWKARSGLYKKTFTTLTASNSSGSVKLFFSNVQTKTYANGISAPIPMDYVVLGADLSQDFDHLTQTSCYNFMGNENLYYWGIDQELDGTTVPNAWYDHNNIVIGQGWWSQDAPTGGNAYCQSYPCPYFSYYICPNGNKYWFNNSCVVHVEETSNGNMYVEVRDKENPATIYVRIGTKDGSGGGGGQASYRLDTYVNGQGTVTKAPDECFYAAGSQVTLTPTPETGWNFMGWTGECAANITDNGNGTYTYTVPTKDCAVVANFSQCTGTITSSEDRTLCACDMPTFNWNNITFAEYEHITDTTSISRTATLQSAAGCDSVVTLNLTILPIRTENWKYPLSYCRSELLDDERPKYWFTHRIMGEENRGDTVHVKKKMDDKCYTVYVLNDLTIYDADDIVETEIVDNFPIVWHGITINSRDEAATTVIRRPNQHGCISTIRLVVVENRYETARICHGTTYDWPEHPDFSGLSEEADYKDTIRTVVGGADSIYCFLHLYVQPEVEIRPDADNACSDDLWNGYEWTPWEGHTVTVDISDTETDYDLEETESSKICDCDSIIHRRHLHVFMTTQDQEAIEVCGPTYEYTAPWGETRTLTYPEDYVEMTHAVEGSGGQCESSVGVSITWKQPEPYRVNDGTTLCASELAGFEWKGLHFTPDNLTQTKTLESVNGCDSIVTFTVTLLPVYDDITDGTTICSSALDEFTWEGLHFSMDNLTRTKTLRTAAGCDSTVTFTLTVSDAYRITDGTAICPSELENFTWEDLPFTLDNLTQEKTLEAANGCDSVVTFTVTLLPTYNTTDGASVCENELAEFEWEGLHFTPDNLTQTKILPASNGCDSVVTFTVTLLATSHTDIDVTACDSYEWNGETYTESDPNITYETTNAAGCDSTATLHLTINKTTYGDTTAVGIGSFFWYGEEHTGTGTAVHTLPEANATGCDSIVTLHLTIVPEMETVETYDSVCSLDLWDDYQWEVWPGHTIAVVLSDDQTDYELHEMRHSQVYDYDSVYYVRYLHIYPATQEQDFIEVCGKTADYTDPWGGTHTFYYPSDYEEVTHLVEGSTDCESVVGVNITWKQPEPYQINDGTTLCASELASFEWEDMHFTPDNLTRTKTLESVNGCDSIVTFTVTLLPVYDDITDGATICSSALDEFTWEGEHFTPTDLVKTKTLPTAAGCDSTVTFTVTLLPTYNTTDGASVCENELAAFEWEGLHFTPDNLEQTKTLPAANGCDSTVTFTVTLLSTYHTTDGASVCENELASFRWEGLSFTDNLTKSKTLPAANGCDSTVTFTVTLLPSYEMQPEIVYINKGGSYPFYGDNLRTANIYSHRLPTECCGCDSIVSVDLRVVENYIGHEYDTICQDQSFPWHGEEYDEQGDYPATLKTVYNTDSIALLHLTVLTYENVEESASICQGESFEWEGHGERFSQLKKETIYYDTVRHKVGDGCDSIRYALHLTVKKKSYHTFDTTFCANRFVPFEWNNVEINDYSDEYNGAQVKAEEPNALGCDSIVKLNMIVNPSYVDALGTAVDLGTVYINEGASFPFCGRELTESRLYEETIPTVGCGCDSTVRVNLVVMEKQYGHEYAVICRGDSYPWKGDYYDTEKEDGYTFDTLTVYGTDSVVVLHLTVNEPTTSYTEVTACDSYEWNGETYTESDPNITYETTNAAGCDSTAILHLTILKSTIGEETVTACDSYEWNGDTYTESNPNITYETTNAAGCDSTAILHLTILKSTTGEETVTACDSYTWNGVEYTESDPNITYETTNAAGCDSTAILHLTIRKSTMGEETVTACDSYEWNGETYTESDPNITYETTNAAGCDSTAVLHLTITHSTQSEKSLKIFSNQLPYTWDNITFTEEHDVDTVLVLQGANAQGCDSTVIRHLAVDLCIDLKADIAFNNATFCADEGDAHATLQVREGRPVSYSVSYPVKDRDGYLQDVSDVALPSGKMFDIVIPVNPATDKERYLRPDDYPVDVTVTDICGIRWELPRMMLHVLYPSWLIVQKWDDVLALYNERYNGGYTFSRIGWYNDGLPVEGQGANNSYIYVNRGQGEMLRFGTPYWAELTREDDGKTICTCPYVPQRMQQAPERKGMEISFAQRGYQLLLTTDQNGTYALYDVTGKTLQTGSFVGQSGTQQIDIDRSCAAGSYLIVFRADDGTTETRKFAIY